MFAGHGFYDFQEFQCYDLQEASRKIGTRSRDGRRLDPGHLTVVRCA
jgi:hypothetical protein